MPGLHVYRSNRLEALASALGAVMAAPAGGVLEPEVVVVQSLGMRRWLSFELAQRHGVAMNVRFPFPAAFVHDVFRAAFGEENADASFSREILPWRVLALFPRWLDQPGWEPLRAYAQGEREGLKRYQLAHKIAGVFDRYLVDRPELLREWEKKRGAGDWQAQMWRELARGHTHPPELLQRLEQLEDAASLPGLPPRLAVFGISSLSQFHLHLIRNVARHRDLHLFLLEPTDQYWGDIASRREQDRRLASGSASAEELHLETGNPLLASLGKVGRDFTRNVQDLDPVNIIEEFAPPPCDTLLTRMQADIFELLERPADAPELVPALDGSIRVHCCHGPMREVEVLHDQLLDLFEKIPDLTPRDILVAMPDVETYAPLIEAVFGCPENDEVAIPFTIADRSARAESGVADTFLRLLDLHGSRFGAMPVLALLEDAAVRRRFDLEEGDLPAIRQWIAATGIRWGIDADHRASLDLPYFADNTWRVGLDRLLLGYALPGDGRTLFDGVLPVREVEGNLATTLGHFADFTDALFAQVPQLGAPRLLADWSDLLLKLVKTFFQDDEESTDEVRQLRGVIAALARVGADAGISSLIEFDVIRAHLGGALADTEAGTGFLAGRVTFCSLKPMRAIPFKVVCLLGMNDIAFPRHDNSLAFDLIAEGRPQRGDRSRRDDDRHLFLEAILSARETLYLSYSGLSTRDGSEAPPSVVVSELLDYLEQNFALPVGNLRETLVTRHRLQAFSPAYFTAGSALFSYSEENARSSIQTRTPRVARPSFSAVPLPAPGPEWHSVDLARLAEFFAHPAKFFCRERLRLAQPEDLAPFEETEPLSCDTLIRYQLSQELTELALANASLAAQREVVRASGVLPFGYAGDAEYSELSRECVELAAAIRRLVPDAERTPLRVDVACEPWRITGLLRGMHAGAQVRHRAARMKGKDFLRAWVFHLALQFTENGPRETLLIGREGAWKFSALDDAPARLADLLELYREGLRAPLPLFPETSMEFLRRTLTGSANPFADARKKWESSEFTNGEDADPWFVRCFSTTAEALDERWRDVALRVFGPLFAARTEVSP